MGNDHCPPPQIRLSFIFILFLYYVCRIGRGFWRRWRTDHPDLVKKRQGNVSMNRALNCSREMAIKHLDELAKELIEVGIFKDAEQIEPGVWSGDIDTSRYFVFLSLFSI